MPLKSSSSCNWTFHIVGVQGNWAAKAERYAVLAPLSGPRCEDEMDIILAIQALIRRRRRRIAELSHEGWLVPKRTATESFLGVPFGQHKTSNWPFYMNCPPFSVNTDEKARPCHKPIVCPFCWSRDVVRETYFRLEWGFYGGQRLHPCDLHLLEYGVDYQIDLDELPSYVDSFAGKDSPYLSALGIMPKPARHGLIALRYFQPTKDEQLIQVSEHFLMMVPPQVPSPTEVVIPDHTVSIRRHVEITRERLAFAAARMCRYPVGMMDGPARVAVKIIEACANKRLRRPYGRLRNKTSRSRAYEAGFADLRD